MTELYDHNYVNCILACTHKKKFNRNVYIPGIICAGSHYTIPIILPSGLFADNPSEEALNSIVYNKDVAFCKKCNIFISKNYL